MDKILKLSNGNEIVNIAVGWETEDASFFYIDQLELKISKITKKRLLFAQQECIKHEWWAIEVALNENDDIRYLNSDMKDDEDYRSDVEYYRVTKDSMIFHSQYKHNSGAQIESEMFNIEK